MDLPQPIILLRLPQPATFKELHLNMNALSAKHPEKLVYVRGTQDHAYVEFYIEGEETGKDV